MENYSYTSGDSSPRSREIDFENTASWEMDQNNYKVKFMCSYGGKIHPRSHDNQLSYIGGETKIFAVDRSIKFSTMLNKLSALCNDPDIMFKYQLPGEDLDALISVTSDDDLDHMMHECDRSFRVSPKPARMRLFLFPTSQRDGSGNAHEGVVVSGSHEAKSTAQNNVDFLFGLERGMHAAPPPQLHPQSHQAVPVSAKLHEPIPEPGRVGVGDHQIFGQEHVQLQRELQRMQIGTPEQQGLYRRKSADNYPRDYYMQKTPEKSTPGPMPVTVSPSGGYWLDKQLSGGFPASATATHAHQEQQPVYVNVIPGAGPPSTMYQAPPGMRPVAGQASQGHYAVQRMGGNVYSEQPIYNIAQMRPPVAQPVTMPPQQLAKVAEQSEGIGMVQSTGGSAGNGGGIGVPDSRTFTQVVYENEGRQLYYTPAGAVAPPPAQRYYGLATTGGDIRNYSQEGKVVVTKVTQGPV